MLSDFTLIQRLGSGVAVAKLNIFAIHIVMPCVLSSHCNKILNISTYHRRHEKFEPLKYRKNEGSKATVHDLVFDVQTEKLSTGRMLNHMEEEKKEAMGAGNLPDFWSGTSERDMRIMTCEANITLISQ